MDPNLGCLGQVEEDKLPDTEREVIPVCDRGAYSITNADPDDDE